MTSALNIVLVGPMGVGKSTIGKQLAKTAHRDFKDTDHIIEERTGADIPWIFDVEGEAGFRAREKQVLAEALEESNLVLATGGGIITIEENRQLLNQKGFVVYLTAPIDQLVRRTSRDRKRPLLQVDEPEKAIENLLKERHPLYQEVSDVEISTHRSSPKQIADQILAKFAEIHG